MLKPSDFIPKGIFRFAKGNAANPIGGGFRYILQVCNDTGAYGAGFSGVLSRRWPMIESNYRQWWRSRNGELQLGDIQVVQVQSDTAVINMIGQHGIGPDEDGNPPIRYDGLEKALSNAGVLISDEKGTAHMPRIGCGLAGGSWDLVEPLVVEQLSKRGINVTVYDLE
jgi:O-acetyl-ADP-ribose deacetylase (regulator of RNase III)